jgi:hypothetical protein
MGVYSLFSQVQKQKKNEEPLSVTLKTPQREQEQQTNKT